MSDNLTPEADYYRAHQNALDQQGVKRHTLSSSIDEFDPIADRLGKAVARARAVGDRINGTRPRQVERTSDDAKTPTPAASIMARLRYSRDNIVRALDQLERELNSLEECL